jgi:RHS repeat-associated protein
MLTVDPDRKAQVTTSAIDALNRLTQVTYADRSTVTYAYDAGNRVTQVTDSLGGTITSAYDGLDRLISEVSPQGTVNYTYDAAGRRTSMTVAGQPTVAYTYDNANRLTGTTQGTSIVALTYNAVGQRTSMTLPNGVMVQYGHDAAYRVTSINYKLGATLLGNLTYAYDAAGNRTQMGGSYARTGLPSAVPSAAYDAANELTQWGTANLTYDANGNLVSDGTNAYAWNSRNQLVTISGGVTASFQYDGTGRRVQNAAGNGILYDGYNVVQELSGGVPTANMLTGPGLDELLRRTDSAGTRTAIEDGLGSTVALLDPTGTVQTQYTYEPFGKATAAGATSANPTQFSGRDNDQTGLYYYRARYYSPGLQRFISEDPVGLKAGVNFYLYATNPPFSHVECSGLFAVDASCNNNG